MDDNLDRKGKFIVFEGLDGCGKTTQMKLIAQRMKREDKQCQMTCEPTKNDIGVMIRKFLSGEKNFDNHVVAALFAADRLDHITNQNGLLNILKDDIYILCDRYYLSSYAYQSIDIDLDWLMDINSMSVQKLKPDCHIYIDITPETAWKRINERGDKEIFEEYDKLKLIYDNYHTIIKKLKNTENIVIIDGDRDAKSITDDIWNIIMHL